MSRRWRSNASPRRVPTACPPASDRLDLACLGLVLLTAVAVIAVDHRLLTRPLWYDEQWRAFFIFMPAQELWSQLHSANAPMAFGWLLLERLAALLGNRELWLRLPMVAMVPAAGITTYLLARRWLRQLWATAAALLVVLNGSLLTYGLQLKSYPWEAVIANVVLLLWWSAHDRRAAGSPALPCYAGMGLCCVLSLTAPLVVAPLLLADAVAVVGGRWWRGLLGPLAAGTLALAHLVLWVRPQRYLTTDQYWQRFFLPHSTHAAGHALWSGARGLVPEVVTAGMLQPETLKGNVFEGSPLTASPHPRLQGMVAVALVVLWTAGALRCLRSQRARPLLLAICGAGAGIVAGAYLSVWPLGWNRANLLLAPALILLAVTGAEASMRALRRIAAPLPPAGGSALQAVAGAALAGVWSVAALFGAHWTGTLRTTAAAPMLLGDLGKLVEQERAATRAGDAAIVLTGRSDVRLWIRPYWYYMDHYDGHGAPGGRIPPSSTYTATHLLPDAQDAFLRSVPARSRIQLILYNQQLGEPERQELEFLRSHGWCAGRQETSRLTGTWIMLLRCGRPEP
jgi:hypothetical protein